MQPKIPCACRDGSSNALDPDQAQGPMHSYSQMLGLGDEAGGPKGRQGEGLWEGRGSSGGNNFHSPSFPGVQHQGPGRHGGVVSGEPSQRMQPGRGSWSNGDPPGKAPNLAVSHCILQCRLQMAAGLGVREVAQA